MDYVLGNWGTNTKFKASQKYPMKMFYDDFDKNGRSETIVATEKDGKYYPLAGLDELAEQLVSIVRKKFTNYEVFAGKTIEEVIGSSLIKNAALLEVHTLESGYLKNDGGHFSFQAFGPGMQVAPITAFVAFDFDHDGQEEVFAAGNYFGVKPYHSRFDSFSGALIKNETTVIPCYKLGIDLSQKAVRALNIIKFNNKSYLLITINNNHAEVYEIH